MANSHRYFTSKCIEFLCCFSFVILIYSSAHSQSQKYKFHTASLDLGSTSYGGVLQDDEGFIWFSSLGHGLLRYDGFELKKFPKSLQGLSGSMVSSIVLDKSGILWIATFNNGLTSYNKKKNRFVHYRHEPGNPNSLSTNNLPFSPQLLFVDQNNNLWVGTENGGLNRFDQDRKTWNRYLHDPENQNTISNNTVNSILEDNNGMIWIGTANGLNLFDPVKNQWAHYKNDPEKKGSLSDNWINCLLKDKQENLWIGTNSGGLNRYQPETNSFVVFKHKEGIENSIGANNIWNLYEDRNGYLWICHYASKTFGLEMFDPKKERFIQYSGNRKDLYGLSSISIPGIVEDRNSGILFVINGSGIVDKYDPLAIDIMVLQHDPKNPNTPSDNLVLPIIEDSEGIIWFGTGSGGLNKYNPQNKTFSHFLPGVNDTSTIPNAYVTSLMEDNAGNLWVGSSGGNLSLFDRSLGKVIKTYTNTPEDLSSISASTQVKYLVEDKNEAGVLWIATIKGGINKFDTSTEKFIRYKNDIDNPKSLSADSVVSLYDDGNGKIWAATYGGGLDVLDKQTGEFIHHTHDLKDPTSINSNTLYDIFKDSYGRIWVSGKGGISLSDIEQKKFKTFNKSSGLESEIITSILEDNNQNLWLGTIDKGIIRFNPKTGTSRNYTKKDGLPGNAIFWTARAKTKKGMIWFGGKNGAVRFNPEKIKFNPIIPPVVLTSFKQGGKEVRLDTAPERLEGITLDWNENFFEFQFAALNFSKPHKNQYAYMLEGRDSDWYFSGHQPFGRYTGLQGGSYLLKLKGSNNDGIWNNEDYTIKIIVKSPFWRTQWFFFSLACLCLTIIGFAIAYFQKLKREIKDRKQAENKIIKSEKKYRDLIDTTPDLRYRTDLEGKIVFVSPSVQKLSGYTVDEAIGMKMAQEIYVYPDQRDTFLQTLQKKGSITDFEAQLKRKDGSKWWASTNAQFSKDEGGNILGVEGVTRDITERKLNEEQLSLQSGIITRMSEGISLFNKDNIIVYTNPAFERIFGYDSGEMIGFHLSSLNAPTKNNPKKTAVDILNALKNTGKWVGEIQNIKKDGTSFWTSANVTILEHPKYGEIFISVQIDISELKQTQNDKKKLEEQLQQVQKMESIGNLAGGIAHDFNNLLFPIIGMSEMLLEDLPTDGLEYENAKEIFNAGKRAGDLVKQILAFSRQSEHKMKPVRVQNVLKEVLNLSRSIIPTNIEIHEKIQQNSGLVLADPTQIHQIAMNLITNAFHAVEEKNGIIDIKLKEITLKGNELPDSLLLPGKCIRLSISDNGTGMSQNTIYKIFEPYFTTKEQGKGTGLGLAVVYGIVKEHGGDIKVYSEIGKGTTFNIFLPLMKKTTDIAAVEKKAKMVTGTEKILLIDDEVSVAKIESQMLSRLGYQLTTKTSSVDALNMFESNPDFFDLVISDMTMPNLTGDQLAKEILAIKPNMPIIICTGFSERINKEQAEMIGVKGFLLKPVIKSDMAQMVRNILDNTGE